MSTRRRRAACGRASIGMLAAVAVFAGCSTTGTETATTTSSVPSSAVPEVITSTVPVAMPPFIARVMWVQLASGRSLQVYPTASGRAAKGAGDADTAWSEVLADDPTAGSPGMRAQFDCHWTFARIVAPDKPSWNLEPWRPVVTAQQMIDTRCNPGGAEE